MNKPFVRAVYNFTVLFVTAVLVSCGGGGGGGGAGTSTLNLSLTDAPNGDYKAVYVTINEVWVKHEEKNWEMLNGPDLKLPQTLNLLEFVNGTRAQLGIVELEVGHYNQMRLIVEDSTGEPQTQDANGNQHPYYNYVIDSAGNKILLKVPSGGNTGIKTDGFNIERDVPKDIVLDFDANKSVHAHPAGKTGEWRLRPTIKVVEVDNLVNGVVDEPGTEDDSSAWVTAQLYDADAGVGSKEEVFSVAGVSSMINGTYLIRLPINTSGTPYNIVAVKDGFLPECQALDSAASGEYEINFTLTPSPTGTISGSILNLPVPPSAEDSYSVFLSIRKFADCDGDDVPETLIEVVYKPYVNLTGAPIDYGPITLTEGEYELVAWADGVGTLYPPFDITIEGDVTRNVDFGPNP